MVRHVHHYLSRDARKPDLCLGKNKDADQLCSNCTATAQLISAFVFATWMAQFLFYLNLKLQASNYFHSLHRPVCVRPGQRPRRPVFSRCGSLLELSSFGSFRVLSPYLTGMRQLETSSRIVRDYFATKINDINTTFTLQSH